MKLVRPLGTPSGRGCLVVFFPHAGGSPRFFTHLAAALPHCRVFGVTYPGRDHLVDAAPVTDMGALTARIAHELATQLGTDAPTILVGHSLGAFVAYETAAVLTSFSPAGRIVVVASGQNPPLTRRARTRTTPRSDDDIVADVLRQNPASAPIWSNAELRSFFLPAVRADYSLLDGYMPSQTLIDEIRIVVGDEDTEVDRSLMPEWQRVSHAPIHIATVRGGHFYLDNPDLQLIEALSRIPNLTHAPEGGRVYAQETRSRNR